MNITARSLHGSTPRRLYKIWNGMKQRCSNQNKKSYADYGAKGVGVCREWAESFPTFRDWALANGYRDDLTIDRFPDTTGNYEPSNCRWATRGEQARNTRRTRRVTAFGETKVAKDWASDPRCVVPAMTLSSRLRHGWDAETAIATPSSTMCLDCKQPIDPAPQPGTAGKCSQCKELAKAKRAIQRRVREGTKGVRLPKVADGRRRDILRLRSTGMSYSNISKALTIPQGTVVSIVRRG